MGSLHADKQSLEKSIRKSFPRNLLQIDLEQLRGRIEEDCWTKRAEIRRVLPSEIIITIEERVPSVILELRGELMLADDEGILLDEYAAKYGKLDVPVFKGLLGENPGGYRQQQEENSERVKLGRKMLSELEQGSPAFSKSISEVDLSDKSDVRVLLLDDSAEIHMGDREFLKRFRTLMSNMPQYQELKLQYNEIASVDLRFDGQIIYRPHRSSGTPAEVNVKSAANR
jgi:cell division septal protein FtsQ